MENRIKKLSVMLTILMGFTSYAIADTVEDYKKSCIEMQKGVIILVWLIMKEKVLREMTENPESIMEKLKSTMQKPAILVMLLDVLTLE